MPAYCPKIKYTVYCDKNNFNVINALCDLYIILLLEMKVAQQKILYKMVAINEHENVMFYLISMQIL